MSKTICVAQTVEELKFLQTKGENNMYVVPLDLEVQIYCIEKNINYFNPLNYIKNTLHKQSLNESEKLINSIKYKNIKYESQKLIVRTFLRFRLNSIFYLINLLKEIYKKNDITKTIVSGWENYEKEYSENNYYISKILRLFFKGKKIIYLEKKKRIKTHNYKIYNIKIKNLNFERKNYILVSNLGYNFFRFIKFFNKKNYKILAPYEKNINIIKKTIYKLFLNVKFFKFSYNLNKNKNKILENPNINFKYKNKKIRDILISRFKEEKSNLINLQNKCKAIDTLFNKINFTTVISNNMRGEQGYYLECASKKKISTISVPHGTVSEYYNKYDKIYKKNISEAIIYDKAKYIASQSLIAKKYFLQYKKKYKKNFINTGNLIFCDTRRKKKNKKINILFGVTLKKFYNIQFLGVEMYYEFLSNLKFLNKFSKKNNFNIYVKLHPAGKKSKNDLQSIFPNLIFTSENLKDVINKVDLTISFSSTVIEDSLNSFVPVILLDRWKRYKHCRAEINYRKKNSSIYYINNENNLLKCIKTINNSKHINFKKNVTEQNANANISKFMSKI